MQYKNSNTAFHRSSAVSVALGLKSDVTAVLNCEKIDNFACLKARKNLFDRLSLLDMLVASIWYRLMLIIILYIFALFFMDAIACVSECYLW